MMRIIVEVLVRTALEYPRWGYTLRCQE